MDPLPGTHEATPPSPLSTQWRGGQGVRHEDRMQWRGGQEVRPHERTDWSGGQGVRWTYRAVDTGCGSPSTTHWNISPRA